MPCWYFWHTSTWKQAGRPTLRMSSEISCTSANLISVMMAPCLNETDRQTDRHTSNVPIRYLRRSQFGSTTAPSVTLQCCSLTVHHSQSITGWSIHRVAGVRCDKMHVWQNVTLSSVQSICVPFGKRRSDQFTLRYKRTQKCLSTFCTHSSPAHDVHWTAAYLTVISHVC